MEIGRRIFYDIVTGEKIVNTGERSGNVFKTTVEHDIKIYQDLSERQWDSFDFIELEYGQYNKDFEARYEYRVNPKTKEIEFSYPDPDQPEPEKPATRSDIVPEETETNK